MCTQRTKFIMTMMHALIMQGHWALCEQYLWSHYPILSGSLLVPESLSEFWTSTKQGSDKCLSVLNHYTTILQSVMSWLQLFPMSIVSYLSGTSQSLSTWHSPHNQLLFGLYQVFLSNWEHSRKHYPNSFAAGPSTVCKKSAKGLWKVGKDSLQSQ